MYKLIKVNFDNSRKDDDFYVGVAFVNKKSVKKMARKDLSNKLKEYKKRYGFIKSIGIDEIENKLIPQIVIKDSVSDGIIKWLAKEINTEVVCDYIANVEIYID